MAHEAELRYERLMAGRLLIIKAEEDARRKQAEEDEAERQRINAIRLEQLAATMAKKQKEMEEREKQHELDNLFAMRKEELVSINFMNYLKELERFVLYKNMYNIYSNVMYLFLYYSF